MNNKLFAILFIAAALLCVVEGLTKEEVFQLSSKLANEQESKLTKVLVDTVESLLAKASTVPQRMCIRGQLPSAYKSISEPIDNMWENLKIEYDRMSPTVVDRLKVDALTRRMRHKYNVAVSTIEPKLNKIRKCVP